MADTPSDDTPAAPPPRRRTRATTAKSAGARAKPTAKAAPRRAGTASATKGTSAPAKPVVPKARRKPKAAAAAPSKRAKPEKRGFGRIFALTAATVLSVAAGAAAIFGRRRIAKVSEDIVGSVVGKDEPEIPVSAD